MGISEIEIGSLKEFGSNFFKTFQSSFAPLSLPNLSDDHICKRMHGHNWLVEAEVQGDNTNEIGMVIDFKDIKIYNNSRVHFQSVKPKKILACI